MANHEDYWEVDLELIINCQNSNGANTSQIGIRLFAIRHKSRSIPKKIPMSHVENSLLLRKLPAKIEGGEFRYR